MNISTASAMRDREMFEHVPDHLKTEEMCQYAAKNITFSNTICSCLIQDS